MKRFAFRASALTLSLALSVSGTPTLAQPQAGKMEVQKAQELRVLPDAEIKKILVERIDTMKMGVGIVVGVIEPQGRRIIAHGTLTKGDARPLNGKTMFEIGSITKVFTSLLLADMVQRGEVALTDPVANYLPEGVKVPQRNGKAITLQDLSQQISGLPRLPKNLLPKNAANPYADYSAEQLYAFLSAYELPRDIGSKYEYSNLGVGLLGHALARRAGMDFEQLVRTRISDPLGMKDTTITLTPNQQARLAPGHSVQLTPVANWDTPTLAGAVALRSDVDDMLTFLAANLGYAKSKLSPAMAAMLATRKPTGDAGLEIGLGWHIATENGVEIIWHNGGTGGYRSFVGFNLATRVGVVALSNTNNQVGVDDIGMHLLDPKQPLMSPPKEHKEVTIDAKLFDQYLGRYALTPAFTIVITREGDRLFAQATNQPRFELFATSNTEFFLKVIDAQITFITDEKGKAISLTLHQNGAHMPAKREE